MAGMVAAVILGGWIWRKDAPATSSVGFKGG